jgi:hypothetical protein
MIHESNVLAPLPRHESLQELFRIRGAIGNWWVAHIHNMLLI